MRVIGIDPSLHNTAVALIQDHPLEAGKLKVKTIHLASKKDEELAPGTYTNVIKTLLCPSGRASHEDYKHNVKAGFVEDFSNIGGGDTNKIAIKSLSHAGGMAEEALAALGIPMIPITVRKWRKTTIGRAPKTITKSGIRSMSYWTKGDTKYKVPNNLTPALLELFNSMMKLMEGADYSQLVYGKMRDRYAPVTNFQEAMRFIIETSPTSTRIKKVFGVSLDELEAAGIALAGYRLIKSGQIEGL